MSAQYRPRTSLRLCVYVCVCVYVPRTRAYLTDRECATFAFSAKKRTLKHAFPRGERRLRLATPRSVLLFPRAGSSYSPCAPALRNRVRLWQTIYELCKVYPASKECLLVTRESLCFPGQLPSSRVPLSRKFKSCATPARVYVQFVSGNSGSRGGQARCSKML